MCRPAATPGPTAAVPRRGASGRATTGRGALPRRRGSILPSCGRRGQGASPGSPESTVSFPSASPPHCGALGHLLCPQLTDLFLFPTSSPSSSRTRHFPASSDLPPLFLLTAPRKPFLCQSRSPVSSLGLHPTPRTNLQVLPNSPQAPPTSQSHLLTPPLLCPTP